MSIRFLKVKVKTLAAEARIIRFEERRSHGQLRNDLHSHRVHVLRREARATLLAYGYARGKTYASMEGSPRSVPDWDRVERMIKKYSQLKQSIEEWKNEQTENVRGVAA